MILTEEFLNQRIRGLSGDAALVSAVPGHKNVALFAPQCAPRVLDDIVVLTIIGGSISDNENTVIESMAVAIWGIVDSIVVELEAFVGGVDGNRDRSDRGQSLDERPFVSGRNVDESGVRSSAVPLPVSAFALLALVRVGFLSVDSVVLLDVGESIVHEAATASIVPVCCRAVDQVLLRERDEFASLPEQLTFKRSGGGERPARPAVTLVLDGGDGALRPPVDGRGDRNRFWFNPSRAEDGSVRTEETIHGRNELMVELK